MAQPAVTPPAVRRLLQAMPKAELHVHLDGCLRPATAIALARAHGVDAPWTWAGMFDRLVAPPRPGTQAELLRSFELPIRLMQHEDALERITTDLVEDKAADRVRYVEVKWAPAVHGEAGLSVDDVIAIVAGAAARAGARHGVEVRLTVVAMRSTDPTATAEVARAAVRHRDQGVTGFDLAGDEGADPDPTLHATSFDVARAGGLGITVHAGELLDDGSLVRRALDVHPARIAHGASAIADDAVVAELIARDVTLDLCPTSNLQAGTVTKLADHPAAALVRRGVGVTINTDDTTISDVTLSDELCNCHTLLGMTLPELWRCNVRAVTAAFVDEGTRARLLADLEAWGGSLPDLQPPA